MNNTSFDQQPTKLLHAFTTSEKIIFTTGLTILSLLTLFGNTLVIMAFYKYRPLRTRTNYFIVSLSVSDILVALISMPVWAVVIITDYDKALLIQGKLLMIWTTVDIMTGIASILNLTTITIDRYLHVTRPLKHPKLVTRRRVVLAIILIWVFSFFISLSRGIFFNFWNKNKPSYETMIVSIGFLLPLIVISFCYLRIYQVVRLQINKFNERTKCLSSTAADKEKTDVKALKTIAVVVMAFFFCWCPFFVLNLYNGWCHFHLGPQNAECVINRQLVTAAKWLHYCNSSLNPIIYACFNREFRLGFKTALYKHFAGRDSSSSFSSMLKKASIKSYFYEVNGVPHLLPARKSNKKFQMQAYDVVILDDMECRRSSSTQIKPWMQNI